MKKAKGFFPYPNPNIKIKYDGSYPNLCSGTLKVTIGSTKWVFPSHCLSSGGYVHFDDDWNEDVGEGPWTICQWPKGFPEEYKERVIDAVNSKITWGCCGGCI
jgi:hypothetical protein